MSDQTPLLSTSRRSAVWSRAVRSALVALYCLLLLVRIDEAWPAPLPWLNRSCTQAAQWIVGHVVLLFPVSPPSRLLHTGLYLGMVAGLLPLVAAWTFGARRLSHLGVRVPNALAWRYIVVGIVAAMPFLWWMSRSPRFSRGYLNELHQAGLAAFLSYYFVNMLTEHLLLHGVVVAVSRRSARWPADVPVGRTSSFGLSFPRWMEWLGLKQPPRGATRAERFAARLGLPEDALVPILFSATLFALVHWGKDSRELVLSIPSGVLVAFIALRTNSFATPLLLHLATAGAALLMISA